MTQEKHLFVIDDSGSPGSSYESLTLKNDKKTYVAVFIAAVIRTELEEGIKSLVSSLCSNEFTIDEFHFTDLINRRRAYKELNTEDVLYHFQKFADLLNQYELPYFIQSMTPRTLAENGMSLKLPKSLDEQALDFLCLRMAAFIKEYNFQGEFDVLIDEGLKKPGQKVDLPMLTSVTSCPCALAVSSKTSPLVQVADFFAFGLNRHQLMAVKDKRTEFDLKILEIVSSVFAGNRSSGSGAILMKKDYSKEDYDRIQIENLKNMGVYEFWKKNNQV